MTTTKTTPSEPTGIKRIDPLVDYGCVRLDGKCDCLDILKDCKYAKLQRGIRVQD